MTDELAIRELVEAWADAVHQGDIKRVLRDHTDDIVMFDVPPPDDGVRGIDAYRETWPPFFQWPMPSRSCAAASPTTSSSTPTTGCG